MFYYSQFNNMYGYVVINCNKSMSEVNNNNTCESVILTSIEFGDF